MWTATLAAQRVALEDSESVLLVDDGESEVLEVRALLDQRMRANHEIEHAALHLLVNLPLTGGAHAAGQQRHAHRTPQRRRQAVVMPKLVTALVIFAGEESLEGRIVLRSQHFRWGHEHRLMTGPHRRQHGCCGNDGLARSDIALQQPRHRFAAEHVVANLGQDALLGDGELERQYADERVEEIARHWDRRSVRTQLRLALSREHRELNREQFLKGDPLPGSVDFLHLLGKVDHPQGFGLGGKLMLQHDVRRQRLGQQREVIADRNVRQSPDCSIRQALRPRVDGR